jgi:putative methionine-R-sulfoxide reductase with GAF domain
VSDQQKPVLDEQTFGKLLEAAFVIQEHGADVQQRARKAETNISGLSNQTAAGTSVADQVSANAATVSRSTPVSDRPTPTSEKTSAGKSGDSETPAGNAYAPALAQIVETQQQILAQGLELESVLALVAQRAAKITMAGGAAIGIVDQRQEGTKLQYRTVHGLMTPAAGSEVDREKALCFTCLRSGEVVRCADVKADLLLDTEQCRSRGIESLIAVPIYHDKAVGGALEVYFAAPNTFTEQDVHSCQLMAGLVTEALARASGASSRKSLAIERATLLAALEKLRPNLKALMDDSAAKQSTAKSAGLTAARLKASTAERAATVTVGESAAAIPGTVAANAAPVPSFPCRKCGHKLVGEEMFCGKCGCPRTTEYQPPTLQSKVASLWHMQQAGKSNAAVTPVNGTEIRVEHKKKPSTGIAVEPWEAVLSELKDPFEESEPALEFKHEPELDPKLDLNQKPSEIPAALCLHAAGEEESAEEASDQEYVESDFATGVQLRAAAEEAEVENAEEENEAGLAEAPVAITALTPVVHALTWTSAAKAKEGFDQLASSQQNSFARFWNTRRGDVYLAVAVILVAGVIRWSMAAEHSFGAGAAAKASHHRAAADADLSAFDKFLISIGVADPPDPPEDKGNPDTQVWVDLHSALYYCPGADLYGKTPKGKYTTQRDAQLGQFEPAYRKACN